MKDWEFLIQKEGDRIWQPIQQQSLDIEEGKYRLVAHSIRPDHEVEIRILHQYLTADLSSSETKTHFRRTNSDGLIMLLPFTYLQPGSWEVRCYGDIMSELLGDAWQAKIRLQVLPKKSRNQGTQSPEKQEQTEEKQSSSILIVSATEKSEHYFQQLNQLLQNEIEPRLKGNSAAQLNLQVVQVILDQDCFYRNPEEIIAISGQVEAGELPFKGKLSYELTNPETEEVILILDQDLFEESLPFKFQNILEIPTEKESPFLLGEIIIESVDSKLLARQPFTIETELDQFTEDIVSPINYTIELEDTDNDLAFAFDVFIPHASSRCFLDVALPNPSKMRKPLQQASSSRQILPPKLTPSSTATAKVVKSKSLQLPLKVVRRGGSEEREK